MLTRKLQELKGSYYIYLPKDWCKKIGLKANDLLNIEELSDGSLIIRSHDKIIKEKLAIKIEITDKLDEKILKQILKAAYAIGVESLEIKTSTSIKLFELTELVIKILTALPGFEIVEEFENKIKIQNTGLGFDIIIVMRKLFTTVYNMLSSLSDAIKNNDLKLADSIVARDNEVDRNYMVAERLSHLSLKNPSLLWDNKITILDIIHFNVAAKYIERIGDHILGLAYDLLEGKKLDPKIIDILDYMIKFYEKTAQIFFTKNFKEAKPLLSECEILEESIKKLFSSVENRMQVFHTRRIMRYCIDLAQISFYQQLSKISDSPIIF